MAKRSFLAVVVLACCCALIACSTAKAPAAAAIQAAEEALAGVKADASVYVPDQFKEVETALAAAKSSFEKKEYAQALAGAKDLAVKAKDLATAVAAKKDELTKNWQDMSGGLPGMVKALQSRMSILSKSRKLPAGIDKNQFESAQSEIAGMPQALTDATSAFNGGNLMEAVSKATSVKDKAAEIMAMLGMKPPEAAMK